MDENVIELQLPYPQQLRLEFNNAVLSHPINRSGDEQYPINYPGIYKADETKIVKDFNRLLTLFKPTQPSIYALDADGDSIVHVCATHDMIDLIYIFAALGIDIDAQNPLGLTPLNHAAINNCLATCQGLVELGAHVNHTAGCGWNPLGSAVTQGYHVLADYLSSRGATLESFNTDGNSYATLLAQTGDTIGLAQLIKHGLSVNHTNLNQHSLILTAATANQLTAVKKLHTWGANINKSDTNSQTPMHIAAIVLDKELIQTLYNLGAEINPIDKYGETPLFKAVYQEDLPTMRQLIEYGANIHHQDKNQNGLLHLAAYYGCDGAIRFLVKQGLDLEQHNMLNETPLITAMTQKMHQTRDLLIDLGANPTIQHTAVTPNKASARSINVNAASLDPICLIKLAQDIFDALDYQLPQRASRLFLQLNLKDQQDLAGQIIEHRDGYKTSLFDYAFLRAPEAQHTITTHKQFFIFLADIINSNDFFRTLDCANQNVAISAILNYFQLEECELYP